jgi:hypothetical protein
MGGKESSELEASNSSATVTTFELFDDLIASAERGDLDHFEFLLTAGLPINALGSKGYGVFQALILHDREMLFRLFMKIDGVDCHKKCNSQGHTPLMVATKQTNSFYVESLLAIGQLLSRQPLLDHSKRVLLYIT